MHIAFNMVFEQLPSEPPERRQYVTKGVRNLFTTALLKEPAKYYK